MAAIIKDLGIATAYGYAKSKGYTGTEEEFAELMASYAEVAQTAQEAAEQAIAAKGDAETAASDAASSATSASGSASTATTKAGEASQSATSAAGSATTATTKAGEAATNASTASTKAGEAASSATAAGQAQTAAETAQSAAEAAQTAAEAAQSAAEESAEEAAASAASIDPDTIAKIDGYYESMTVGNAEQLVATVGVEDSVPYNFRTSGGNADIGDREVDKLIGGTVAWNQLVKNGNFMDSTLGWIPENSTYSSISASDGVLTVTAIQTPTVFYNFGIKNNQITPIVGHKYLFHAEVNSPVGNMVFGMRSIAFYPGVMIQILRSVADQWTSGYKIINCNGTGAKSTPYFAPYDITGFENGSVIKWRNIFIIDLTQMFGSTIADYIYSLETATEGAGVAWFKRYFPKPYYAYNAGELMSVKALNHDTVGFNAFDGETEPGTFANPSGAPVSSNTIYRSKNYIPVIPGATYYAYYGTSGATIYSMFYDANKNLIEDGKFTNITNKTFTVPSNAAFMRLTNYNASATYMNDICINLSWDGERDGEYEPYKKHSYSLGNVELRGIPKLDSDNKLYYDGDTYESDGTVTRKYGIVDLGTLTWSAQGTGSDGGKVWRASLERTSGPCICPKYSYYGYASWAGTKEGTINTGYISPMLFISDSNYSDADAFKTAMSGVYLVYELATPTTETADPFQNPQIVDDFGTEEYVDRGVATSARDVAIPVGHETTYQANLRAKLEMSPDSPDGDGDYIVRQSNGENTYVPLVIPAELPTTPGEDGTYVLKVTVSSGTPTLSWVSE